VDNSTSTGDLVTLSGMTITGGDSNAWQSFGKDCISEGIENSGTLALSNAIVSRDRFGYSVSSSEAVDRIPSY
jgi:hypothetical protein